MGKKILHRGQHPYRHKAQEVDYSNSEYPGQTTLKQALDSAIGDRFVSKAAKRVANAEWLSNNSFENWNIGQLPTGWTALDVGAGSNGTIERSTTKVHSGSSSAYMDTSTGTEIPGFGALAAMLQGSLDLSAVGHTFGLTGYITKDIGAKAQLFGFLSANDGADNYTYHFSGASAGTWQLQDGPTGSGDLFTVADGSITNSFTQALDISGIAAAPAGTTVTVYVGATDSGLGEASKLYLDTLELFDEADSATNLLTNGGFETWTDYVIGVQNWSLQDTYGNPVIEREATRVENGSYSLKLTEGENNGSTYILYEQKAIDVSKVYNVSVYSGVQAGSAGAGRLALVRGNPSDNNTDTAQWGYDKAYNFSTNTWDDTTNPEGWSVSLTLLSVGGTDYNDAMFYAPEATTAIEQITSPSQILTSGEYLTSGGNLNWATATVTGGAFDGNNITILYVQAEFANASALETYLTTQLGATSVSVTNFYTDSADGMVYSTENDGNKIEYDGSIPSGTSFAAGSSPTDTVYGHYHDGFGHRLDGLTANQLLDLSTITSGFEQTSLELATVAGITTMSFCLTGSGNADDVAFFDNAQVTPYTVNSPVRVFDWKNEEIDPDNLASGDYLFDMRFPNDSTPSVFNMDYAGAFDSPKFDEFNFTKKDVRVTDLKQSGGYNFTEQLVSVTDVDMTAIDDTLLYTPGATVQFIPTRAIVKLKSIAADGADGALQLGNNNPDYNNFVGSYTPTSALESVDVKAPASDSSPLAEDSSPVYARVSADASHSEQTVTVYLFGYLLDIPA